jgi:hypothetical protein
MSQERYDLYPAQKQALDNSPFALFSEVFGERKSPEAVALRQSIFGPLFSGAYNDSQRRQLPLEDYSTGLRAFLGTNWPDQGNQLQDISRAQSLGHDPLLMKLLYPGIFGKNP